MTLLKSGCNPIIKKSDYPEHLRNELANGRPEILSSGGSVIVSLIEEIFCIVYSELFVYKMNQEWLARLV